MARKKKVNIKKSKVNKPDLIKFLIIVLGILVILIGIIQTRGEKNITPNNQSVISNYRFGTPTPSPTPSLIPKYKVNYSTVDAGDKKQFTSTDMGLSFYYPSNLQINVSLGRKDPYTMPKKDLHITLAEVSISSNKEGLLASVITSDYGEFCNGPCDHVSFTTSNGLFATKYSYPTDTGKYNQYAIFTDQNDNVPFVIVNVYKNDIFDATNLINSIKFSAE